MSCSDRTSVSTYSRECRIPVSLTRRRVPSSAERLRGLDERLAAGASARSRCQAMPISRAGYAIAEVDDLDRVVAGSTVSRGTSATPMPAATSPARCRCRRSGRRRSARVPATPEPLLDLLRRAAGAVADQRQVDDLAQRRRLVARCERRVLGHDEHVRVAHQLDGLERARAEREDA